MSPTSRSCLPPKGSRIFLQYMRRTLSIKSIMSALTILISSIMISSISLSRRHWSLLYFSDLRMLRGLYLVSFGSKGWNGNLKKLCSVQPPALIAAMPVGASMTCFFFVLADMYRRKVDLPVPAFPVRKRERRV